MKNQKLAIVGMDAYLGACESLDSFDRTIYKGQQHFNTASSQKHRDEIKSDLLEECPKSNNRQVCSQQLLMLHVADNALNDAKIHKGSKTAVIIIYDSDHLNQAIIESVVKNICHTWNFSSYSMALDLTKYSQFRYLKTAQKLLINKKADTVLCIEITSNLDRDASENASAVVLKLEETAKQKGDRTYAIIDAVSLWPKYKSFDADALTEICHIAMKSAGVKPEQVGYLEVCGDTPLENETEIEGLIKAYQNTQSDLSCALGTVKSNLSSERSSSGMASLIKTALCLYHRYIPAFPQWSEPKNQQLWQNSPFYIAPKSRPWFLEDSAIARIAAINGLDVDGTITHLILSENPHQTERSSRYLEQTPLYLFPLAVNDVADILEQIQTLERTIENCDSLAAAASQAFATYQNNSNAAYTLAILGRNQAELQREIQRALQDIPQAWDDTTRSLTARGTDWQTPVGSYFTANPLGKKGKVTFVYPGSFNSYLGIFRDLFRLFPQMYDDPMLRSVNERAVEVGKILYPRSWHKLTRKKLELLEKKLVADPTAMVESELGCASFITNILEKYFKLIPQCSMGYSLGETTMMYAQGVWSNFNSSSRAFNTSPLFKGRVSGAKNTVRKYWNLPTIETNPTEEDEDFWGTYVLMASATEVARCLKNESRVYLTQINTPQEVIVAGDPQACQRIMKNLKCSGLRIPFNLVMHCEPLKLEYSELRELHTLPIQAHPPITFYSSANYEPIQLESDSLGHDIARCLSQQVDFPRLIDRVYQDEVRIFIEIGAGSSCTRWIDAALKDKEHLAVSFNRRGFDDHTSFVRALAKLVSHRVPLDLSPLYIREQAKIDLQPLTILTGDYASASQTKQDLPSNGDKYSTDCQYQQIANSETNLNQAHAAFLEAQEDLLRHMSELIQMQLTYCEQLISENSGAAVSKIDDEMASSKELIVSQ